MRELPRGTVTFLFTDIEGSTRLLHELGAEEYATALAEHRRVCRGAFERHGGVEVDTQGDAFFVAFPTAPGALEAAREAQEGLGLRVRMGLHTGTPLLTEEGYVGADVHRAARIAAAGHGRQVLVSTATAALVDTTELHDLGEHRLKDLSAPERIFQLGDADFPPLRSLNRTNLPAQPSDLIGRGRELEELQALVRDGRLVTLTGPGGSGKTRLALQVAAELVDDFADGVFFVPLAAVADAALVEPAIAQAIGAKPGLAGEVGTRTMLLLLDNLEQVLDAAPLLADVLGACPNLHLLVTSRALLRLDGEREYAVEPLAEEDAVALFLERATVTEPLAAVHAICRRLDGLPLAVELAAARTRLLPPGALLARLEHVLPVLTGGRRDAPERQHTLRATIAWSYELLDEHEQGLFRRLGVFAGSSTVEAAEQVCDADLETLESLLEKSLLRRWASGRLGMLETIREFAAGQLDESGEADAIRRRHAEFFLELAEAAGLNAEGQAAGAGEKGFAFVIPEGDNLRRAIDFLAGAGEIEAALRLAVSLEQYWLTNSPAEGARRLKELLAQDSPVSPGLRARALRALSGSTYIQGEFEEGMTYLEQALAAFRALGDDVGVGHILVRLAIEASRVGDSAQARSLAEESLALSPNTFNSSQVAMVLGSLAFHEERYEEALAFTGEAAAHAHEIGFVWWEGNALTFAAEVSLRLGRVDDARRLAREGLELQHSISSTQNVVDALSLLASAAAASGAAEHAGTLWGAVEAEAERVRLGQWEAERDAYVERMLAVAGPDFDRGYAEGRRLTLDDAVALALSP